MAIGADDVDTYAEYWAKLYNLKAYLALKDGGVAPDIPNESNLSDSVLKMVKPETNTKEGLL
jgi:hypothetical protein